MKQKDIAKTLLSIFAVLLQTFATISFISIFYDKKPTLLAVNIAVVIALTLFYLIIKIFSGSNFHKLFSLTIFCYFLIFFMLAIMKHYGVFSLFGSVQKIKELILNTGAKGVVIFILIQIAQVIISPIPGLATVIVGSQIYGEFKGFIYSSIGIIIGSIIAFSIGKLFGKKVVNWFAGEEATKKYRLKLEKKGKFVLPVAFLFPFFPDDILCIIAGITTMSYRYFITITIIIRPLSILFSSYLSGGNLIPFSGYYLIIWAVIIIAILALFVVICKKQDKIEKWFIKKFKRKPKH